MYLVAKVRLFCGKWKVERGKKRCRRVNFKIINSL